MSLARPPRHPALRPFVQTLWVSEAPGDVRKAREWVLPTGTIHLVFRFDGPPLHLYRDGADEAGWSVGRSVVGGPRQVPYLRALAPSHSVGVQFFPGGAAALLGLPASELNGRHFRLDALWGRQVSVMRERLEEMPGPAEKLDLLEEQLVYLLFRSGRTPDAVVAWALEQFARGAGVKETVQKSGYSHRHFVELFRRSVGLAPKTWCRVQRFQRALHQVHAARVKGLAEIAVEAGYSDQAHFSREFAEMAGMSPTAYRALSPEKPNHVPVTLL